MDMGGRACRPHNPDPSSVQLQYPYSLFQKSTFIFCWVLERLWNSGCVCDHGHQIMSCVSNFEPLWRSHYEGNSNWFLHCNALFTTKHSQSTWAQWGLHVFYPRVSPSTACHWVPYRNDEFHSDDFGGRLTQTLCWILPQLLSWRRLISHTRIFLHNKKKLGLYRHI